MPITYECNVAAVCELAVASNVIADGAVTRLMATLVPSLLKIAPSGIWQVGFVLNVPA